MSVGYIIKEGFAGISRARLAAFTSMFSLFIAVLLIGILSRAAFNAYQLAQVLRNSVEVEIFLKDLDERSTQVIRNRLEENEIISNINYISKDSAAAIFRQDFGAEGETLADLKFLPASFRLNMEQNTGADQIRALVEEVQEYRGVDEVRFNQRLLELLEARFQNILMIGSGIGLLILFTALVLVFNTIRLTIYAKRGLIKAMKLVGATNAFIRRPFLVEGIIQGLVAGGLAVGGQYLVFQYLVPHYIPQLGILSWPYGRWYYLTGAMILLALLMGFFGSRWAARKFIKETSISTD